jgi:hypothetical protein
MFAPLHPVFEPALTLPAFRPPDDDRYDGAGYHSLRGDAIPGTGNPLVAFWAPMMKRLRRGAGDQYLHRESKQYRDAMIGKLAAY